MYGAIIGDIVGSKYEFSIFGNKTKDFPFVSEGCSYTDDTIMTVATAKALMDAIDFGESFQTALVRNMQAFGRAYPHPQGGYGSRFSAWIESEQPAPYYSFGNGAAMRVSPCGLIAVELKEALSLAKASAEVTHNHPEGIKGAQATAAAVFLAAHRSTKEEIRQYIQQNFYPLEKTLDEIRPGYLFDESCQGTVPQAITAFLESLDYEDAVRNAISLGGDADTLGAITGAIAWSYYRFGAGDKDLPLEGRRHVEKNGTMWFRWCEEMLEKAHITELLPKQFVEIAETFDQWRMRRVGTYHRTGNCSEILI